EIDREHRAEVEFQRSARRLQKLEARRKAMRDRQEARESARRTLEALREPLDQTDRVMWEFHRSVTAAVDLLMAGVRDRRQVRGAWRRRRTRSIATKSEIERYGDFVLTKQEKLVRKAWQGDEQALEKVLLEADRHHFSMIEGRLLEQLPAGEAPYYRDMAPEI